jgi:hypothetical protein
MEIVEHQEEAAAGGREATELGGCDKQPLMPGLTGPADVPPDQGPFDFESVHVIEPIEHGWVLTAEVTECLENRSIGPRSLDGGRRTAPDPPPSLSGQGHSQLEHGGLSDAGWPFEHQGASSSGLSLCQAASQLVADLAPAEKPVDFAIGHGRLARHLSAGGLFLDLSSQPPRFGTWSGTQLLSQSLIEALELPQGCPQVAVGDAGPDQGEMSLLIGRVLA